MKKLTSLLVVVSLAFMFSCGNCTTCNKSNECDSTKCEVTEQCCQGGDASKCCCKEDSTKCKCDTCKCEK